MLLASQELARILPSIYRQEIEAMAEARMASSSRRATSSPGDERPTDRDAPAVPEPAAASTQLGVETSTLRCLLQGIGSVLDIFPPAKTYLPADGDAEAIRKDWQAVASDLWAVVEKPDERPG